MMNHSILTTKTRRTQISSEQVKTKTATSAALVTRHLLSHSTIHPLHCDKSPTWSEETSTPSCRDKHALFSSRSMTLTSLAMSSIVKRPKQRSRLISLTTTRSSRAMH